MTKAERRKTPEYREQRRNYMRRYRANDVVGYSAKVKARIAKRRQQIADHKRKHGCRDCAETDPRVLQFHHRNPAEKEFGIGEALRRRSLEALLKEAEKCDILCANCHIKIHIDEYD